MADIADVVPRATSQQVAMMRAQLAAGPSYALRDGQGRAVACGGLVGDNDVATAWFAVDPVGGAGAMRAVLRAIALTLREAPYSCVVIETETPMGRRMARLLGAVPATEDMTHGYDRRYVQKAKGWQRPGDGPGAG